MNATKTTILALGLIALALTTGVNAGSLGGVRRSLGDDESTHNINEINRLINVGWYRYAHCLDECAERDFQGKNSFPKMQPLRKPINLTVEQTKRLCAFLIN